MNYTQIIQQNHTKNTHNRANLCDDNDRHHRNRRQTNADTYTNHTNTHTKNIQPRTSQCDEHHRHLRKS